MPRCLATAIRFSPFNLEKGIKDQLISRQFPSWKVCRLRVGRLSSPPLKPLFQAASDAPSCEWSGPCSVLVSVLVLGLWCLVPALWDTHRGDSCLPRTCTCHWDEVTLGQKPEDGAGKLCGHVRKGSSSKASSRCNSCRVSMHLECSRNWWDRTVWGAG